MTDTTTSAASIANSDLRALRNYITAKDETQYANVDTSLVIVDLTHSNLKQRHAEIRFNKKDTLDQLRHRIYQKTGTPSSQQHLQVWHGDCILLEIPPETSGNYYLGYFGIEFHGMRIHCIDIDPYSGSANGAYENTALVEKFVLSEDEYTARKNTLRAWSNQQRERDPTFSYQKHAQQHREMIEAQRQYKLGLPLPPGFYIDSTGQVVRDEPDIEDAAQSNAESLTQLQYGPDSVAHVSLQSRCEIQPGARRGVVAYVGTVPELPGEEGGQWVGVTLDEPLGSNDGSVNDTRYFDTLGPKYGAFVRGSKVQCGDFPELDCFSDDDEI